MPIRPLTTRNPVRIQASRVNPVFVRFGDEVVSGGRGLQIATGELNSSYSRRVVRVGICEFARSIARRARYFRQGLTEDSVPPIAP